MNLTKIVFTWDTYQCNQDGITFGASGATTDRLRAIRALNDPLQEAPAGSSGVIWKGAITKAELDLIGTARYEYAGIIARAQRDTTSSHITWSKGTHP